MSKIKWITRTKNWIKFWDTKPQYSKLHREWGVIIDTSFYRYEEAESACIWGFKDVFGWVPENNSLYEITPKSYNRIEWHKHRKRGRMSEVKYMTMKHIETVRNLINDVIVELMNRSKKHDQSKLESPEAEAFEEYTPKLKGLTYGSAEYKRSLDALGPALDHHYANNRHHPEHFKKYVCNGCFKEYITEPDSCNVCGYLQYQIEPDISQMNLVDLIEMFCDWKAATLRHADGDINVSIEINKDRFKIDKQLVNIFKNTAVFLESEEKNDC